MILNVAIRINELGHHNHNKWDTDRNAAGMS